ncbi:MAG: hypothetical protein WBL44_18115 [Nitrososphaeraceae archaeon]
MSSRIILHNSYLVNLLSTKWPYHVVYKVTSLKQAINQDKVTVKICMMGFVAVTAVLLAFLSIPSQVPGQLSAQITPSLTLESSDPGIGFMAQDSAASVQNSTGANITQLATIIPTVSQPITPASFTPVSEEADDDESDDSSSSNDDDESDSSSGDDDNNDDSDDNGDDDGDGGGSSASAGGGGAFAFAG